MLEVPTTSIKPIDKTSIHRITSGQVVIDLQTAVKELVENSVDAGATQIEVRFKHYGLRSIEVIDNGTGITKEDFDSIGLKHHTSKLETYDDLTTVRTFGFRGEALSSLRSLCEGLSVATATEATSPKGACLEMDTQGRIKETLTVARQRGTTVTLRSLFLPLPVRRKEFERNAKREFGKALALLHAYALGPCAAGAGVRLTVSNQVDKGQKSIQIQTPGTPSSRASVTALWGHKALDSIVTLDLSFEVQTDKAVARRLEALNQTAPESVKVQVKGLVSKFAVGCGRNGTDRQFFYINGRPCNLNKVQKAFNEVYRSFNANQSPFILADFIIPTESCDVNVSPDKRTILIHNESNLISAFKAALENEFSSSRNTFSLGGLPSKALTQTSLPRTTPSAISPTARSELLDDEEHGDAEEEIEAVQQDSSLASRQQSSSQVQSHPTSPTAATDLDGAVDDEATSAEQDQMEGQDDINSQHLTSRTSARASQSQTTERVYSPEVVIDTTRASWSQSQGSLGLTTDDASRPRKKRKSDFGEAIPIPIKDHPPQFQTENAAAPDPTPYRLPKPAHAPRNAISMSSLSHNSAGARSKLRDRLAGFARPGSQLTFSGGVSSDEEGDEEAESAQQSCESQMETSPPRFGASQLPEPQPMDVDEAMTAAPIDSPSEKDTNNPKTIDLTIEGDSEEDEDPLSILSLARQSTSTRPSSTLHCEVVPHPEIIRQSDTNSDTHLRFDHEKIVKVWNRIREKASLQKEAVAEETDEQQSTTKVSLDASVSNTENDTKAADALARIIEKQDFASMYVIGQFNLGFIIARRRSSVNGGDSTLEAAMDDLFIVDQHASDEKYNFETLQLSTRIQSQKLLRPQPLELTAADELLAIENIDILRSNGFEVECDENGTFGQGNRLKLFAQPVSRSTNFDMKDLEELIHLMRDRSSGQMVRCSKARAMFAMRACRKSVMVGMPLNHSQMLTVVRHMGMIDQPWNCPHGRPTMRHLADLTSYASKAPKSREKVDWSSFL